MTYICDKINILLIIPTHCACKLQKTMDTSVHYSWPIYLNADVFAHVINRFILTYNHNSKTMYDLIYSNYL